VAARGYVVLRSRPFATVGRGMVIALTLLVVLVALTVPALVIIAFSAHVPIVGFVVAFLVLAPVCVVFALAGMPQRHPADAPDPNAERSDAVGLEEPRVKNQRVKNQ